MTAGPCGRRGEGRGRPSGPRRRALAGAFAWAAAGPVAWAAGGQAWPGRAVRIVVVYPPGGVSDGVARRLARELGERAGVPVVVENRPGAGGSLAMELLARAVPDGHVLAFSALTPLTLNPLWNRVGYDPFKDIAPVVGVMHTPVLVVGTPAFGGVSLDDAARQARAAPGSLRWASSGVATTGHMVMERFAASAGVTITHIPYHGGGPQINDALAGRFEILSTNVGALQLDYVRQGKLRALAVGAPRRLPALPAVPTLAELGYPEANRMSLFALFAPGGTPPAVIEAINAAVGEALRTPSLAALLAQSHNLPAAGPSARLADDIRREYEANRRLAPRPDGMPPP